MTLSGKEAIDAIRTLMDAMGMSQEEAIEALNVNLPEDALIGSYPRREPPMSWGGKRYDTWEGHRVGNADPRSVRLPRDTSGDEVDSIVADLRHRLGRPLCAFHQDRRSRHHAPTGQEDLVAGLCDSCARLLDRGKRPIMMDGCEGLAYRVDHESVPIMWGVDTRFEALLRVMWPEDPVDEGHYTPDVPDHLLKARIGREAEGKEPIKVVRGKDPLLEPSNLNLGSFRRDTGKARDGEDPWVVTYSDRRKRPRAPFKDVVFALHRLEEGPYTRQEAWEMIMYGADP